MEKYKGLTVKQSKLNMSYDEYVTYLTTRKIKKKGAVEATQLAIDKFDKVLYTKHKNELNDLFIERYNMYAVPSFIFIKLGKIANGTFNGMNGRGISLYNILRYMKAKGKYLTRQSFSVKFKNGSEKLNYELSVVINDYPRFKKESLNKTKHDPREIGKYDEVTRNLKKTTNSEGLTANDIIKDIFGGK